MAFPSSIGCSILHSTRRHLFHPSTYNSRCFIRLRMHYYALRCFELNLPHSTSLDCIALLLCSAVLYMVVFLCSVLQCTAILTNPSWMALEATPIRNSGSTLSVCFSLLSCKSKIQICCKYVKCFSSFYWLRLQKSANSEVSLSRSVRWHMWCIAYWVNGNCIDLNVAKCFP